MNVTCATKHYRIWRGWKGPAPVLSQQRGEAEGSRRLQTRAWMGAALTTTGRTGTARRCGSGKRDRKVDERNQCLTSRNRSSGSNLVDMGRMQRTSPGLAGWGLRSRFVVAGGEATRKACGVLVAMLPG
jgi:hypothetical protein